MSGNRWTFLGEVSSGTRCRPAVEELETRTLLSTALGATGIPAVSMLAGTRYTGRVALFKDPALSGWDGKVTVTIDWGDGTGRQQTTDIRTLGHGVFEVWGTHNYANPRATPYTLAVQVKEKDGSSALATSLFQIVNPTVSLHLGAGPYSAGRAVSFQVSASQTPNNHPPTAYLVEYRAPTENIWHVLSRGAWQGTSPAKGTFTLAGTLRLPKSGQFYVRAMATVGGIEYPSASVSVTVR